MQNFTLFVQILPKITWVGKTVCFTLTCQFFYTDTYLLWHFATLGQRFFLLRPSPDAFSPMNNGLVLVALSAPTGAFKIGSVRMDFTVFFPWDKWRNKYEKTIPKDSATYSGLAGLALFADIVTFEIGQTRMDSTSSTPCKKSRLSIDHQAKRLNNFSPQTLLFTRYQLIILWLMWHYMRLTVKKKKKKASVRLQIDLGPEISHSFYSLHCLSANMSLWYLDG